MNLVTGATGMLGSHIALDLLRRGFPVRALYRKGSDRSLVEKLDLFYHSQNTLSKNIDWIEGDVLDITSLQEAMIGCDTLYHCAAVVSYHSADRENMYVINVEGTTNVVNTALEIPGIKLCFVSSIAALGKAKDNDILDETTEWVDSAYNTHYAITKNLGEMEVWRGIQEGLNAFVVNPGLILGPGDFDRSSASIFKKLDEGLGYYPPGGTGFVGIQDCASMTVDLMLSESSGERYILVAENATLKEVFQQIAKALGKKEPSKMATPFILQVARIGEWLKEKVTGRKALVTTESVKNSSLRFFYENVKIQQKLNRNFRPITDSIGHAADFYQKTRK